MPILIAYRRRGSPMWNTHGFRLEARSWRSFYRQARLYRDSLEYAYVRGGDYQPVL